MVHKAAQPWTTVIVLCCTPYVSRMYGAYLQCIFWACLLLQSFELLGRKVCNCWDGFGCSTGNPCDCRYHVCTFVVQDVLLVIVCRGFCFGVFCACFGSRGQTLFPQRAATACTHHRIRNSTPISSNNVQRCRLRLCCISKQGTMPSNPTRKTKPITAPCIAPRHCHTYICS